MKTKYTLIFTFMLIVMLRSICFAQDNTQAGLPEGAIARLGKGGINVMQFSPDGKYLAVGTGIGLWLYDVSSGKETALLTDSPGRVNAISFSVDGKILAIARNGLKKSFILLWDLVNGKEFSRLSVNNIADSLVNLAFTHDQKTLISLGNFGEITHWDIDTGSQLSDSKVVQYFDISTISPLGKVIVSGHENGNIRIWDAKTGKLRKNLRGHASLFTNNKLLDNITKESQDKEVSVLAFSTDGNVLASGSLDKNVILWDIKTYKKLTTLKGHNGWITAITFSPDGKTIASGDADNNIKIWDFETKQERFIINKHNSAIGTLVFSPDSNILTSGSYDGKVRFWDPDTGGEIRNFATGHAEWIISIAFSENSDVLTSASLNGDVDIWSLKTKRELMTISNIQNDIVEEFIFSPDAMRFASRGANGMFMFTPSGHRMEYRTGNRIKLWEISTGKEIPNIRLSNGNRASTIAFATDNKTIAYGHSQEIIIYDSELDNNLCQLIPKAPIGRRKLLFSPDTSLLATYGSNVRTQVWNTDTQQDLTAFFSRNDRTELLAFSPDSKTIAIKYPFNIILSKVTPTGIQVHKVIHDSVSRIRKVLLFSPDGKYLVAPLMSGVEKTIQIWDVETGNGTHIVTGHIKPIETLAFSHDGQTLASGSKDGTILLWDWNTIIEKNKLQKFEQVQWRKDPDVVLNWLQQNHYQFKNEGGRFVLQDSKGSSASIGTHGMGSTMNNDVHIMTDGTGGIRISINKVGVADYFFDNNGILQSTDLYK